MAEQTMYGLNYGRADSYGAGTYRRTGNAETVPETRTDTSTETERTEPGTFLMWIKSHIAPIILVGALVATISVTCFMLNRMVESNAACEAAQSEVALLRRDANSGKEDYNTRLANTDVDSIARNSLGMQPAEGYTQIAVTEIPR